MTIRLMIADDHELIRCALAQYLEMQHGIAVVAEAASDSEVLSKLKSTRVDLLLLDMVMPGRCGADTIAAIKSIYPALRILILSARDESLMVLSALQAGASGYLCKREKPQMLLEAIHEVMLKGSYLAPDLAERLEYAICLPQNFEIPDHHGKNRLNGKTIQEWKEDCLTFYQEKHEQQALNNTLNDKNIALENEAFDLSEKLRRIQLPSNIAFG